MQDHGSRPCRIAVTTELGRTQTLADCRESFARLGEAQGPVLFVGLGPSPWRLPTYLPQAWGRCFFVECPECAAQMPEPWRASIPADFQSVPVSTVMAAAWPGPVFFYLPGLKHFPSFFGPLWAKLTLDDLRAKAPAPAPAPGGPPARERSVIVPGTERSLLVLELRQAFARAGYAVTVMDPADVLDELPRMLRQGAPDLFFSVNLQGLDEFGRAYFLLRQAGTTVAAWCVDNPFHLISRLRAPFWRMMPLFVTDDWFVTTLGEQGATKVFHLPLAANPRFFDPPPPRSETVRDLEDKVVFVGRSEFPGKRGFFSGCQPPAGLAATARGMLAQGGRPDFGWWVDALGLTELWPDSAVRVAGCGAEEAGRIRRTEVLTALSRELDLAVYGDGRWAELLPNRACRGAVDYYGALAAVYAAAGVNLNVTGLLLPHGLTQRHFDVWAAGGVLASDDNPGLGLFPAGLRREMTFSRPDEAVALCRRLLGEPGLRADLGRAWRAEIAARHTYDARVVEVCSRLERRPGRGTDAACGQPA
ncbi:MAG: DUF3880 domain-containing protein [Desulfovibrionaceae bacterium]|nr:DUF3880 domain-containing protein [Desulfovibrionaceae bacterium]